MKSKISIAVISVSPKASIINVNFFENCILEVGF